jgi:hypothetical protein
MLKCIFSVSYSILKCSRIFIVCPGKTALLLVVRVPVDTMNDKIPSVFRIRPLLLKRSDVSANVLMRNKQIK